MTPIEFQGKEYADQLITHTTVRFSIGQRIMNLFRPEMQIRHDIYSGVIITDYKAVVKCIGLSYWDLFLQWKRFCETMKEVEKIKKELSN